MSTRNSLTAVALFLALSFTATGASAVDVEATERLVRQTMSSAGISPNAKAHVVSYIAPVLERGKFVEALRQQGVGNKSRRERLWEEAKAKQALGGDSTVRAGRWAVAVVVGDQEFASHKERLAHEFFHGLLVRAKDIPSRFDEGLVEALTKRALGRAFVGSSDYLSALAAMEALVSASSVELVGQAYRGKAKARRALAAAMEKNLPAVRSALAADSAFTSSLVSGLPKKSRIPARNLKALQNANSSAWDVLLGLFEADLRSWARDAALRYQEGLNSGFNEEDAKGYGAAMARSRPYLELAGFLASGDRAFLDEYQRKIRGF